MNQNDNRIRRPLGERFFVKVCGITNLKDAEISLKSGANALGFNFYPQSPRCIGIEQALEIISQLNSDFLAVGIMVAGRDSELPDLPMEIAAIQIHGVETAEYLPDFGRRTIVAVSPQNLNRFPDSELIVDTSWGRGKTADWGQLKKVNRPYILSGGLNPQNIKEAMTTLHPIGVDVCSGVESRPGLKDETQLVDFLRQVKRYAG